MFQYHTAVADPSCAKEKHWPRGCEKCTLLSRQDLSGRMKMAHVACREHVRALYAQLPVFVPSGL